VEAIRGPRVTNQSKTDPMPAEETVERCWLWRRRGWTTEREYGPWHVETEWADADADGMRLLASDDPQVVEMAPRALLEEALEAMEDETGPPRQAHPRCQQAARSIRSQLRRTETEGV
jgi:hypothetical protein